VRVEGVGMDRKVKVLIWIEALAVALLVFGSVFVSYFASVAKLNTVLKDSGSYNQIAKIAQIQISDLIPEEVKSDPIAYGVINWGINRFVTVTTVEKISEPALNTLVKMAKTPTTIVGTNVVLDTGKYKAKLSDDINGFNIPQGLKNAGNKFVDAIPAKLNVVNLEKHPNSILARVIKVRDRLAQLRDFVNYLAVFVVIIIALIGFWSRENLTKLFKALGVATVASGGTTLLAAGILAVIATNVPLYSGSSIAASEINTMLVGLSQYYLKEVAGWGFGILLVGGVVLFFTAAKVQKFFNDSYKKLVDFINDKTAPKKK
jgi:hypothetical protein